MTLTYQKFFVFEGLSGYLLLPKMISLPGPARLSDILVHVLEPISKSRPHDWLLLTKCTPPVGIPHTQGGLPQTSKKETCNLLAAVQPHAEVKHPCSETQYALPSGIWVALHLPEMERWTKSPLQPQRLRVSLSDAKTGSTHRAHLGLCLHPHMNERAEPFNCAGRHLSYSSWHSRNCSTWGARREKEQQFALDLSGKASSTAIPSL